MTTAPEPDIMVPLPEALAVLGMEDTPENREWLVRTANLLPEGEFE